MAGWFIALRASDRRCLGRGRNCSDRQAEEGMLAAMASDSGSPVSMRIIARYSGSKNRNEQRKADEEKKKRLLYCQGRESNPGCHPPNFP